jgi:hypothetical protein
MMKDRKDEFSEILSLWKGQEAEFIQYAVIRDKMLKKNTLKDPKKWYEKKVQRRLEEMRKQQIIERKKNGLKGAEAFYKPTFEAKEFDANHFFEEIRESSKQKSLVIKENESLFVYGIPSRENLTSLENSVLDHTLSQIEDAFEKLFLLKQSIKARKAVGQPIDQELLINFLKEKIADRLGNMIYTEAELKLSEEPRKEQYHGLAELIIETAKKSNITYEDSDEILSEEKRQMELDSPRLQSTIYVPKGTDADLAILKTLPSCRLAEYELNPYSQLLKLIESWEPSDFDENLLWSDSFSGETVKGGRVARNPRYFDDADIFYLAQAFVRHMSPTVRSESSLTFGQIEQLAGWGKLDLLIVAKDGTKQREKLVRSIYHFWKEHQDNVKSNKEAEEAWLNLSPEEKQKLMEPREPTIKIAKVDLTKQERITPEISAAVKTRVPAQIERRFTTK